MKYKSWQLTKVRKFYFQYNKSCKWKIPLTNKNGVRFKFLKIKCSKNNPYTYTKYMDYDNNFIIPDIIWKMAHINTDEMWYLTHIFLEDWTKII